MQKLAYLIVIVIGGIILLPLVITMFSFTFAGMPGWLIILFLVLSIFGGAMQARADARSEKEEGV